jgi:aspartate racemase
VTPTRKVVGVIGGMGPDSTVDFFAKLVAATHAERDQDHLRILIDNDPTVPDRTAAVQGRGPSPAPRLAAMARGLIRQGAEVLVMPCNGAHAFRAGVLDAAGDVPFLDLIETTVAATRARLPQVATVGLLATDGTLGARLYDEGYAEAGVRALAPTPDDQALVMEAIYAIKRGRADAATAATVRAVAERLVAAGAEAIAAACTEIPLVLRDGDVVVDGRPVPVISSTDALVARTVAFATASPPPG